MCTLIFSERFNYISSKPFVIANIIVGKIRFRIPMLIDSGADVSMLPKKVVIGAGIDLSRCKAANTTGTAGDKEGRVMDNCTMSISNFTFTCPIIAMGGSFNKNSFGLLGRCEIFPKIRLAFREKIGEFYISSEV